MHVRCPHCHDSIEIAGDASFAEINCPSCGSSFSLIGGDTTETFRSGTRRLAHFELVRELGIGKFGSVWMARDTQLDRTVAIKIPRKGALDAEETELFLRDARAAAQLKHPNIVGVHEVGREHDTVYIVTDYIEGANLKEWLSGQRLSFRESAELIVKVAEALHHAHKAGVVHRDLKPGNIMVDRDGQPHVIDFGLAKRETGEITMTVDGHILGTPAYMSPEQAKGHGHEADARSDVYALGVILFELLTGELPFRGEKQMLLMQIQRDEPPRPRKLNARIPRDLETVTLKCLEKEPARRYQTGKELADELKRFLAGESIHARPVGRLERGWRWCKRQPIVAGLAAAVLLALLAGTTVSTYFAVEADARAREAIAERTRAEESSRRARQAVNEYYTHVSESTLLEEPRLVPLRKDLIEAAMKYYREFLREHSKDPVARGDIAATHFRVAELTNAVGSSNWLTPCKSGVEILEELVREKRDLSELTSLSEGWYKVRSEYIRIPPASQTQEVLEVISRARTAYEALVDRFPDVSGFRNDLAGIHHILGMLHQATGQTSKAMTEFRMSRDQWEKLARDAPSTSGFKLGLARAYHNLGGVYKEAGELREARAAQQRAVDLLDQLVRESPDAETFKRDLAKAKQDLTSAQRGDDDIVAPEFMACELCGDVVVGGKPVEKRNVQFSVHGGARATCVQHFAATTIGETIEATISVPIEDVFNVSAFLAAGPDCGIVEVMLDGSSLGTADCYQPLSTPWIRFELGRTNIKKGLHKLCMNVTGKNAAASAAHVGLISLQLRSTSPLVQSWSTIGTWPCPQEGGWETAWPPEKEQILAASYETPDRGKVAWKAVSSYVVTFEGDWRVAYGQTYVWSPDNRAVGCYLGKDDQLKVWVNDKVIFDQGSVTAIVPDSYFCVAQLKSGWNKFLVKNANWQGGFGYCVRLGDPDHVLRFALEPD